MMVMIIIIISIHVCIKNNKVQKDKITKQENFGYK